MSLPNPKQYVTEERLNEYHNIILPFLGGMPDILANKFARGDMYSTDEKMIGRWTDGKPIYQRTYVFSSPVVITANTYSHSNAIISNLDSIISGMLYDNSGQVYSADFGIFTANHEVAILHSTEISVNKMTIQYTKTTDSPVEIGNDTDYSTTEKIVGTWIDGKPLYQKTFTGVASSTDSTWYTIGVTTDLLPNVDTIVSVNAAGNSTGGYAAGVYYNYAVSCGTQSNSLQVQQRFSSLNKSFTYNLTLQYTKTTD